MDLKTLGIILAAVGIAVVTLYALDRRAKGEPIVWTDAFKLIFGSSAVTGGVVYAIGTDNIEDAVETVAEMAQDMMVGKPEF